jgi:hypothetical protein
VQKYHPAFPDAALPILRARFTVPTFQIVEKLFLDDFAVHKGVHGVQLHREEPVRHNQRVEVRIRHLTDELHRELKIRAAQESKSLNQLILDALAFYLKGSSKK